MANPSLTSSGLTLTDGVVIANKTNILDLIYPVGSVFVSTGSTSPASTLGGTWESLPANYALWTASSGAGGTISAGLPNIKGYISQNMVYKNLATPSGAFAGSVKVSSEQFASTSSQSARIYSLDFNAANYNPIYSDSVDTVQPNAYKVYAWRRTK